MKIGHEREKKIANSLDLSDISTICATLDFFGATRAEQMQAAFDLRVPKYRLFDFIATGIDHQRNLGDKATPDESNIWMAFGIIYCNTTSPEQFVEALRFEDLQLWEGRFLSAEFAKEIRDWNQKDLEWKASDEYKKLQRGSQ